MACACSLGAWREGVCVRGTRRWLKAGQVAVWRGRQPATFPGLLSVNLGPDARQINHRINKRGCNQLTRPMCRSPRTFPVMTTSLKATLPPCCFRSSLMYTGVERGVVVFWIEPPGGVRDRCGMGFSLTHTRPPRSPFQPLQHASWRQALCWRRAGAHCVCRGTTPLCIERTRHGDTGAVYGDGVLTTVDKVHVGQRRGGPAPN